MFTIRTNTDDSNWRFEFLLEEGDIVAESLGELALAGKLGHIGLPTGQFLINGFDALLNVVGEVAGLYAIDLIRGEP